MLLVARWNHGKSEVRRNVKLSWSATFFPVDCGLCPPTWIWDTFITRMATLSLMTEEDILSTLTDNHSTLGCCLFSSSVLHWYLWERLLSVAASSYLMEIISPSNKPYQRLRIKYIPYGDIFFHVGLVSRTRIKHYFQELKFFFHSTDPSRMLKVHLAWINICEHACCKTKLWDHIQERST